MADTTPGQGDADALHDYWVHGKGAAQIRWGTEGAHTRCHRLLMQHAHMTSEQAWGYCQLAGHAATGKYSGEDKGKGHGRSHPPMSYTRSFPLEDISIKAGGDGRTVDAYAAVFDQPARIHDEDGIYDEILDRTIFNKALSDAAPQGGRSSWQVGVFYNHGMTIWKTPSDLYSMPVGVPVEIKADQRGLFTRTQYLPGELGDRILEAIRQGAISAYSFQGQFLRSNPVLRRGDRFKPDSAGRVRTVRRMESTLREYGPTPFPAYQGAEVVGMRAEQAALLLGRLAPGEFDRLATILRSSTQPDSREPLEPGTSAEDAEAAAEAPPPWHAPRSPKEELRRQRAKFLLKYGGGLTDA